jgi:hypothetical protein
MVTFAPGRQFAGLKHRMFNGLLRKTLRKGIDYNPYDRRPASDWPSECLLFT